jgi:hypothetical protein
VNRGAACRSGVHDFKTKSTNPFDQLAAKPKSKALAIKTMCAHCVGCTQNHLESGFRTLIAECEVFACPLHSFRPYAAKTSLDLSELPD